MKIVEINCKKELNVDSDTAWWNQWDHEHFWLHMKVLNKLKYFMKIKIAQLFTWKSHCR